MKIVHMMSGGDVGGAKTYLLYLLPRLSEKHEVTLIALMDGVLAREAAAAGLKVIVVPQANPAKAAKEAAAYTRDADIVHCHGARANATGMFLKKLISARMITTVHSDYKVDYTGTPAKWLTFGMINRLALRFFDYYVGVSEDIAGQLVSRHFPPERIFHVYNGIDLSVSVPRLEEAERAAYFRSLGLDYRDGDIVCGIAVRLTRSKDLPTLLKAFQTACAANGALKLIIAGRGEREEEIKLMAEKLGLSGRVAFPGWINSMNRFFGSIDINILCSRGGEGLAYAVLEAARARAVTISSRDGGLPALIDSGENGILFRVGDHAALAGHILELAADAERRARLADRLYEKLAAAFSIEVMSEAYLRIYETITQVRRVKSFAICGAYGMGNSGDDAILRSILQELRQAAPTAEIRVMTRDPRRARRIHRIRALYTFNPVALTWAFLKSELYISGGGNLIQDATSSRSLWFYLFTLRWARLCGAKVMMYGCGIGPVSRAGNRRLAGRVIDANVRAITLREDGSLEELDRLGVRKPERQLAADPAVALAPARDTETRACMRASGLDPDGSYICFSIRTWKKTDFAAFAEAAGYAYKKHGLVPVFLQINPNEDTQAANSVIAALDCPCHLLGEIEDPQLSMGILRRMRMLIAVRLHALVFAVAQEVPCIGVSYDDKVSSFMQYAGELPCVALEDLTTDWLCAQIDALACSERQRTNLPLLREREMINLKVLNGLIDAEL